MSKPSVPPHQPWSGCPSGPSQHGQNILQLQSSTLRPESCQAMIEPPSAKRTFRPRGRTRWVADKLAPPRLKTDYPTALSGSLEAARQCLLWSEGDISLSPGNVR